jgi:hypothetical protein
MPDEKSAEDKAETAETTTSTAASPAPTRRGLPPKRPGGLDTSRLRVVLAQLLWAVCALCALVLALAVLLIALDANRANGLVEWILARADNVDLGYFDLENPIKDFDTETNPLSDVKTALFNYGIAALIWLAFGKLLDKVTRP